MQVLSNRVTCLGITLLQMSKVDPKQFEKGLDRRSTMLLTASRSNTAALEEGNISAIEDRKSQAPFSSDNLR